MNKVFSNLYFAFVGVLSGFLFATWFLAPVIKKEVNIGMPRLLNF